MAHLNTSSGDLSSLSAQTLNKPRSRAPVVMTLPPIKTESIDLENDYVMNKSAKSNLNESSEEYYSQITSPINRSAVEAQRTGIYENVPHFNNSLNNGIYFNANAFFANNYANQESDYLQFYPTDFALTNPNLNPNIGLLSNHIFL